jgi:hypothetical protein
MDRGRVGEDRGRVGEDRGSKETDGCPLTSTVTCVTGLKYNVNDLSVSSTLQRHLRHHGTQSASTS